MEKLLKVLEISKKKQIEDEDSPFIICGAEGSSKSNLGLTFHDLLGSSITNVCLDKDDFISSLSEIKDFDTITFDEAGDGLFSRDFASKSSKDLVKAFMIIRARRLITFFILPSFFMIDVYFRRHRIKGLFYVYKRGKVKFYGKHQINQIIYKGERTHSIPESVKPLFTDTFPIYEGRLKEPYKIKKEKKITETLKNLKASFGNKEDKKQEIGDIPDFFTIKNERAL
jgi:hypothetical protein